jgi:hypothetical protein
MSETAGKEFFGVNLKKRLATDRSNGKQALGMVKAKPRPLAAGNNENRYFTSSDTGLAAEPDFRRLLFRCKYWHRLDGLARRKCRRLVPGFIQTVDERAINPVELIQKGMALFGVQAVPVRQNMILAGRNQLFAQAEGYVEHLCR